MSAVMGTSRDGCHSERPVSAAPPIPLTSFVGRACAVEKIKQLLSGARLLTLVGAGGIGKTRPAMRTFDEISEATEGGRLFRRARRSFR
jgi:hypothetical protein